MASEFVKIEGLKEVQDALHDLPSKATAKNIMKRVLLRRAEPIAETARQLAPYDEGHLRPSIHVSDRLTRRQRKQHKKDHKDLVEVFVGPGTDPAAHLQEFGTKHHGAQPFMRPAFDQHKTSVLDGIKDDLWQEIEKAAARLARKAAKAAAKGKG